MTSTSGGFSVGPSSHSYNPYGMAPATSSIMPPEQRTQRWNPYINGQNAYITTPMSQYVPNQQTTTPLHSTCTTMKCTHCQKDFCLPVNTISASYSQLPSSKENNGIACSVQPSLPSRAGKSSDVRYRSFHNFNQSSSSKQCPQHGALYNKGKSRASLALPHPATYAMNSMSFADGISKVGGSISMNSNGCDGNHLFQSNSSFAPSFAPSTKHKGSSRTYESFGDGQSSFIDPDQCALCSIPTCQYIQTPCTHPSCINLNSSYCPANTSSSLYMNNPLNGHGHGSYYYSPHHACPNGTTSASTFDLRPPLQPHHKYGTHYQSGNIPLRNSNECEVSKNKHLCHGIYTPGVTDNCDSEQQTRSKSIRWTKDQLRKIDKVDVDRNNSFTKNQTGSCSSSSQGTITDDSGIHSGNTFNTNEKENAGSNNSSPSINAQYRDSEKDYPNSGVFGGLGRSQATRRPIRKLPNVPGVNPKQAHIVNLPSLISSSKSVERKSTRTLPSLPTNLFSSGSKNSQKTDGISSKGNISSNEKSTSKANKEIVQSPNNNESGGWIKSTTRLSNFFRSVKFSRNKKIDPQPQITRVFGMDLNDLVVSTSKEVPDVLVQCTTFIEKHGLVDGVYRISGISSNIKRLKVMFDSGTQPKSMEKEDWIMRDVHCVPSLIKQFFRELPNSPLHYGNGNVTRISINNGNVTSSEKKQDQKYPSEASNFNTGAQNINSTCSPNYEMFRNAAAAASRNSDKREALKQFKSALNLLTKAQFNTLRHLMLHLNKLSEKVNETGMTAKNLSIVWAPNLLRTPLAIHTGCENGFGGVSIKLNGDTNCNNGHVASQKTSSSTSNKTIIHQDSRGNGSYNCAAAAEQHSKLQFNLIQNTHVIQCLIENAKWLFSTEERSNSNENKNGFASLIMPPYPSSSSNGPKKTFGGSNTQILQMQPKYEEREIKFKTAAMPSSVSTSYINKQPPPTFLERVRYIQPATKQIPLSKRYTASLTTDMNENEEPMMMMNSISQNGNGYIGSTNYLPQNFSTNVQYIPDTLSKPLANTPFIREASQRHSRNYNPTQNINQSRLIQSRGEGSIADHYFNYHQNNQHTIDPGYHNHNIQNQYLSSVYQKPMMETQIERANKNMNHSSKSHQSQQHSCCHSDRKLVEIDGLSTQCRQKGDVSLVHMEENESSSEDEKVLPHTVRIDTSSGRMVNGLQNGFVNSRSSARFNRNNSASNKIGIAAKFCRPRPKSMDAEVLKNLERNCQNLILESKKDKNRSLSDNEDTSTDGENTTMEESSDLFQEKDIDQLMEEQRRISGNNC